MVERDEGKARRGARLPSPLTTDVKRENDMRYLKKIITTSSLVLLVSACCSSIVAFFACGNTSPLSNAIAIGFTGGFSGDISISPWLWVLRSICAVYVCASVILLISICLTVLLLALKCIVNVLTINQNKAETA